jgi:hypothetical protein
VAAGVEVHDGGPGRVRLGTIRDASAESLHAFVGANVEAGAIARTDGWSGYPGAPGVTHQPHVVGHKTSRACQGSTSSADRSA